MNNTKSRRAGKEAKTGQIIRIEQDQLTKHLDRVVRGTVEQTLNALLDAEAECSSPGLPWDTSCSLLPHARPATFMPQSSECRPQTPPRLIG